MHEQENKKEVVPQIKNKQTILSKRSRRRRRKRSGGRRWSPPEPSCNLRRRMSHVPSSSSSPLSKYSYYDITVLFLISLHLLFSVAAAFFVVHFQVHSSSSSSPLLCRRFRLLLGLNTLWPVRLLLLLFSCLLSLSELLRLPPLVLCNAASLSSLSFAEPAFLSTLLFLLRSSVKSSSSAIASASIAAVVATLPFLALHSAVLFFSPWVLSKLSLPPDFLSSTAAGSCPHALYDALLLALLAAVYVPLFVSACSSAVTVVINKRLRARLYSLAATVVVALAVQVTTLAMASLWRPGSASAQVLDVASYAAVLTCAAVGQGILVVRPMIDALVILEPEKDARGAHGEEPGEAFEV